MTDDAPRPTARVNLSKDDYPFTIEALNSRGEVVWYVQVLGPRSLSIPPLHMEYGPITIRTRWPDGRIEDTPPPASH
jgi:hypothetical protein